jgi:excinuclease ABC subunit A
MESYLGQTSAEKLNVEELAPWKVLGRKWHYKRKGFPSNHRVQWQSAVLEGIEELLRQTFPAAEWDWTNKSLVKISLPGESSYFASLNTKRREGVDLRLLMPSELFALGRIAGFGSSREVTQKSEDQEEIYIRFRTVEQAAAPELLEFLREFASQAT